MAVDRWKPLFFLGKENKDDIIKKKIDAVIIHQGFLCLFGGFRRKSLVSLAGAASDFSHMNFYPYSPMTSAGRCLSVR